MKIPYFAASLPLYTLVGFLSASTKFLLLPILTLYLTPSDYGTLALVTTYAAILIPLMGVSSLPLANVEYIKKSLPQDEMMALFSSLFWLPLAGCAAALLTVVAFGDALTTLLEIPKLWLFLVPLLALFTLYQNQITNFFILEKKVTLFTKTSLAALVCEMSLTVVFVTVLLLNWQGRVSAALLIMAAWAVASFLYFYRKGLLRFSVKLHHIKAGVLYGLPLIFHDLAKLIMNQSDRIFLTKMISLEATGLYSVGYIIGAALMILISSFVKAYTPFLYERLNDPTDHNKRQIVLVVYLFILALLFSLALITVMTPFIFMLLDPAYEAGQQYVFWIALACCFWGGYSIFAGFLFYYKDTHILGYAAVAAIVANLLGNYLFIIEYGAIGAAYSTVLSYLLYFLIIAVYVNKRYAMPWFDVGGIIQMIRQKM